MGLLPATPPPGPSRPEFWRSPLRGPWLTTMLGSILLVGVIIVATTGFLSHAAYNPDLGRNAIVPRDHDVDLFLFDWPTSPSWLYALTQGSHTVVGLITVPVLLAKLWSVIPRLFAWPPVRSPAQLLERLSLLGLVGGALFEFVTGLMNSQYWYGWKFGFVSAHYWGAWIFLSALALHLGVKFPIMRQAVRERGALKPLMDDLAHTRPEPAHAGGLAPVDPGDPTLSRRGLLGLVGTASAGLLVVGAGQTIGGPLRSVAVLAPRGAGTPGFPVNKTAALARITPAMVGADYRLTLEGRSGTRELTRSELLAMPQHTHDLPIACVEGWTTTQRWTGVRLADLAEELGVQPGQGLFVTSLQARGGFRQVTFSHDQATADKGLLALQVNGEDLSMDHGYPARIIIPALPGVHNTKWVASLKAVDL